MSRLPNIPITLNPLPDRPRPAPVPVMPGACMSGGCGGGDEASRPPAPVCGEVRVNGVEIAAEAIAQEIQHHPAPDAQTAWTDAARALAIRELLLQEARRRGIPCRPEADEAGRTESQDDALVRALLEEAVEPLTPGEEECRRFYEAQRARFRTPDLFEVSHILIEPERDDAAGWAAAEVQARAIAETVGNDPGAFAEAARTFSACPSAHQDGSLGQVRRGELVPPVQAAIEALTDGETGTDPVRSRFGWHLIRRQRRIEGRLLPLELVRGKIGEMLEARSWSVATVRYVATLAATAEIEGVSIDAASIPGGG